MGRVPKEAELLVEFESEHLWPEYKDYLKVRRGNLFASAQRFAPLWRCFELLDKIWVREFETSKKISIPTNLCLSCCL
jgi:hypothetical protein